MADRSSLVLLVAADWYFGFSAVMALVTPMILIGGMTMGWLTPTEAAIALLLLLLSPIALGFGPIQFTSG